MGPGLLPRRRASARRGLERRRPRRNDAHPAFRGAAVCPAEPFLRYSRQRQPERADSRFWCRIEKPLSNPIFNYRNKLARPSDSQREGATGTTGA